MDITITSIGSKGDGLAEADGQRIAVPFSLPGETLRIADIKDGRASIDAILTPAPDRAVPFCRHFGECGGCALQHWSKPAYQAWKRGLVVEALARAGLDVPVDPLVDAHGAGRRRVTLHLRGGEKGAAAGFMRLRTHELIDLDRCPILVPELDRAADVARAFWPALRRYAKPVDVQITATATGLDVDLRGVGKIEEATRRELGLLAQKLDLARLSLHSVLVIEARRPLIAMGKAQVTPPAGGFLQATEAGETALAALALEALPKGAKRIADLFSGVGPFTFRMAERAAVFAVDSESPALQALKEALRLASGLKPVETLARDLFRNPLSAKELSGFDAALFDPPRAGAEAQAKALAASKVPVVVGVSCNPQSFARDAALLAAGGYRLERVTPVDQFAWSAHVELVARFTR